MMRDEIDHGKKRSHLVERKAQPRRAGKSDTDGEELRIGIAAETERKKENRILLSTFNKLLELAIFMIHSYLSSIRCP